MNEELVTPEEPGDPDDELFGDDDAAEPDLEDDVPDIEFDPVDD